VQQVATARATSGNRACNKWQPNASEKSGLSLDKMDDIGTSEKYL
jgi:hypothetical protein